MATSGLFRSGLSPFDLPNKPRGEMVTLTDERHGIRISVLPDDGGEIASFQVRLAGRWTEILYRALDFGSLPPDGWDGRAPLLWPAVGRSFTREQIAAWKRTGRKPTRCRYRLGGRLYNMPGHGFARTSPWRLDGFGHNARSAWAACSFRNTEASRTIYPFDFEVSVTYTLADGDVILRYSIVAGRNRKAMPFAIGNHVSFRMPFAGKGRFEECTLRTPARRMLHQSRISLLDGTGENVDLSRPVPLSRTKYLDAVLAGYDRDRLWVEVDDPNSLLMRVSHAETSPQRLARGADCFFVFWGASEYRYYCPEPWIGRPNALNTVRGAVRLPPGKKFSWEIRFTPVAHLWR